MKLLTNTMIAIPNRKNIEKNPTNCLYRQQDKLFLFRAEASELLVRNTFESSFTVQIDKNAIEGNSLFLLGLEMI